MTFDGAGGYPCPPTDWQTVLTPLISSDRESWPEPLRTLPPKFERFRVTQIKAIKEILEGYEEGNRIMVLDAPPGSGKTVIAESVRRLLKVSGLYVCHTKSLQEQMAADFPYAAVLKGRSNYPTMREDLFYESGQFRVTAADCTKHSDGEQQSCLWCDPTSNCPYEIAKSTLLRSELGVINTSYFLTEANYVGRLSGADFTILDECDTVESELMGFVGLDIAPRQVKEWGLGEPERVTKEGSWREWGEQAFKVITDRRKQFKISESSPVGEIRKFNYLNNLRASLKRLLAGLESGGWVYTGKEGRVSFKPIRVTDLGMQNLWGHSKLWLLMSGTVISPYELMESLGGGDLPWGFVSLPSVFDPANRQVKVTKVADFSRKALDADRQGQIEAAVKALVGIITRHPGQRMLVHTVSYDIANDLAVRMPANVDGNKLSIFTYGNASERDRVLESFTSTYEIEGATTSILFAPSMDRGIDLPDDACRVIVIAKIPYPFLGDRQISARLHSSGGQTWYNVQTVRKIVQMTGRGVRHENDWCVTYILDRNFAEGIWNKDRRLFPKWWVEGLDWKDKLV